MIFITYIVQAGVQNICLSANNMYRFFYIMSSQFDLEK